MPAQLLRLQFDGALLEQGFWIYVWRIQAPQAGEVLYVGRTGDNSSGSAQSAFNRLSSHLGKNIHSAALNRHLRDRGIDRERCVFEFIAYGPLSIAASTHQLKCHAAGALEKALAEALAQAGYSVLNRVHCRRPLDEGLFGEVRSALAADFPRLGRPQGPDTPDRSEL